MKRNFNDWFKTMKTSISNYEYYVDFNKIYKNVDKYKIEINILNSLIGEQNIESKFKEIVLKYPETLEVIPLLLAIRAKEIFIKDLIGEYLFNFKKMSYSIEDYVGFMRKSGLFDLLQNHLINNLYDYALGIEVGLDSNARKNRGGHIMEELVENYIKEIDFVEYYKEMTIKEVEDTWNIDLSSMTGNKVSTKRFDFVIKTSNNIYLLETNFYSSGGSKLNETARSYKLLAEKASLVDGISFVWITDGTGWNGAKGNLEETFNSLDYLFNITDLETGILRSIIK